MSVLFFRLLFVFVVLASCCTPVSGNPGSLGRVFSVPVTIDISGLMPFYDTLPPDEKDEQLRDWACYALRSSLDLTSDGEMPVRHPALRDTLPGEVSPGRVFSLSTAEWGVVAAPDILRNKPLLGGLIDRKYATCNCLPEKVYLFAYRVVSSSTISIAFAGLINAKDLFTPEYGYYSATVSTLADFSNFISRIDDVVNFQRQPGGIILGGRKYVQDERRSLTMEEIAVLYQAYNPPVVPDGRTEKTPGPAQSRRQTASQSAEVNVGFSLDAELDYAGLAEDIREFAGQRSASVQTPDSSFSALVSRHHADLLAAANSLKNRHDKRPFFALRRRYEGSDKAAEMLFNEGLYKIEMRHAYQAARYDGNLQGTRLGMILFYTDLMAKLWMLDYKGAAPRSIRGFRTVEEISVPKLYWVDLARLSKTRLWFGLRQDGFDIYGDKILFQPAVTRVYAASSDPLLPGREGQPNYPSREFLGWWDRHYETIAAVEPYFHKLDQIQKWSCIFMMLKGKKSQLLDFLMSVPVRRDMDFESWSKSETAISKINIPFLDRHKYGRTTECLPLLRSKSFLLMEWNYVLSGGVSLASWKDIRAKMQKHASPVNRPTTQPPEVHRTGRGSSPTTGRSGRFPAGNKSDQDSSARQAPITAEERRNYGTFSAEREQDAIKLNWSKGPAMAPYELVSSLAALQQENSRGHEGERIFNGVSNIQTVVRVKEWNVYLVKTAVSRDKWIYLGVNPGKTEKYSAKAAAAFSKADIFCAMLVSDAYARKLALGKPVVR